MRIPVEFQEKQNWWFFLGSCLVFFILALIIIAERGFLNEYLHAGLAQKLSLTGDRHSSWMREDGPLENATAILTLMSSLFVAGIIVKCKKTLMFRKFSDYAMTVLLFLSLIFYTGEEISWGQRIFGFDTPNIMQDVNVQQEFNLHNLKFIHLYKDGIFSIAVLIWGVILPVVKMFYSKIGKLQDSLRMPLPPIRYVGFFAAAIGYRVIFKPIYGNAGQEGLEFLFALAMILMCCHGFFKPRDLFT